MIEGLGGVTGHAVKLALDVAVLRHQVIANNIANAETPGFTPLRVAFEEHFEAASAGLWGADGVNALERALADVEERLAGPDTVKQAGSADAPVELDQEIVKLAENTVRYQALIEGIAKKMAVIRTAIEDGRR